MAGPPYQCVRVGHFGLLMPRSHRALFFHFPVTGLRHWKPLVLSVSLHQEEGFFLSLLLSQPRSHYIISRRLRTHSRMGIGLLRPVGRSRCLHHRSRLGSTVERPGEQRMRSIVRSSWLRHRSRSSRSTRRRLRSHRRQPSPPPSRRPLKHGRRRLMRIAHLHRAPQGCHLCLLLAAILKFWRLSSSSSDA